MDPSGPTSTPQGVKPSDTSALTMRRSSVGLNFQVFLDILVLPKGLADHLALASVDQH